MRKILNHEITLFIFTLFASVIFGLYLSANRVTDPFLYFDVAFVKSLVGQSRLVIPETGPYASLEPVVGREMLMIQYVNMMGISPEVLQFLPLGAILLAATFYTVAYRFLKSPLLAMLVTLYLAFNLSHSAALYSIFAYALALPIFLGLVLISTQVFEKRGVIEIFLMLVLYLGVHYIHYTIATWLITFLIGANAIIGLQHVLVSKWVTRPPSPVYYLTTSFIIIFLAFNETVYDSYLPLFGLNALDGAVQNFLSYISLSRFTVEDSPYQFVRPLSVGLISTVTLLIILIPTIIGIMKDGWRLHTAHQQSFLPYNDLPPRGGIFTMGVIDSISYSIRGSISTKTFSIVFPLLSMIYVQQLNKKWLTYGMAVLLLLTSIVKFGIFYSNSYVINNPNGNMEPYIATASAQWLDEYVYEDQYVITADLNLYGRLLLESVEDDKTPMLRGFDENMYAMLVSEQFPSLSQAKTSSGYTMNLIALDTSSIEPVLGFVWSRFQPLQMHLASIRNNPHVNTIYDNGDIWIVQTLEP